MSLKREKLISKLEGILVDHIYNNGNSIRYPITFGDGSKLKGRYILDVNDENKDIFYSGKYVFGANELYIYDAINAMLEYLEENYWMDINSPIDANEINE